MSELLYELLEGLLVLLHQLLDGLLVLLLHLLHRVVQVLSSVHVGPFTCCRAGSPETILSKICRRITIRTSESDCVCLGFLLLSGSHFEHQVPARETFDDL